MGHYLPVNPNAEVAEKVKKAELTVIMDKCMMRSTNT